MSNTAKPLSPDWAPLTLPAGLVLTAAVSVQAGAGIASRLFAIVPPVSVTTLRLWAAALILLAVGGRGAVRAVATLVRERAWRDARTPLFFGIALALMNFAIYQAFARIPLGIAVTIEFLGPLAVAAGGPGIFRPRALITGAGIGLLSSVIPYGLEFQALRRVPPRVFGVWMSMQPAVAAVIGLALLGQRLSVAEWAAIGCVAVASAGAARGAGANDEREI